MDISNFTKAGSMYLKAENVIKAKVPVFTIVGEPKLVDKEFEGKKTQSLQVEGELDSVSYKFDLSKTNARIASETLGNDTAKWNGSQLVLETYKNRNSKGVLVDAINVKEVKKIV